MDLKQNGAIITGTYRHSDGRIEGILNGTTLTGTWTQSNGKGRFVFVFNPDGSAFTGKWGYNTDEPSAKWNGVRKGNPAGGESRQAVNTTNPGTPEGHELFNNWNKAAVLNHPTSNSYFYLTEAVTITRIITYHWNNGMGKLPGQIGLRDANGSTLGSWPAVSTSGTGGAQHVNWMVNPGLLLQPGLYQITDSDPETWSHNNQSFSTGFVIIYGK